MEFSRQELLDATDEGSGYVTFLINNEQVSRSKFKSRISQTSKSSYRGDEWIVSPSKNTYAINIFLNDN